MNQSLVKTSIGLMLLYVGASGVLLYLLVIEPGWLDVTNASSEVVYYPIGILLVFGLYVFFNTFKARSLSLNGDQIEIRYIFWPFKVASIPVNDLMSVSVSKLTLPGCRTLRIKASRSGDETKAVEDMQTVLTFFQKGIQEDEAAASWYTDKNEIRKKHFENVSTQFREIFISETIICIPAQQYTSVMETLQPYISRNLHPAYEAQQKRLAEQS